MMPKSRIEVQNGNDELTFATGTVTIGGRNGANVVIRDVMIADRHCVITYEHGFVLRDTDSVTGTWVNGERAAPEAQLTDGCTIVIGTSKLQVSIENDDGTDVLKIKTDPQSFWWKKPGKGAFDNDPDQLAYSETKFGRFPALRLSNRMATIGGSVVLIAAMFLSSVMEPLADPGPLMPQHNLVASITLDDPAVHAGIRKCVELSGEQGCNVCHETGNGTPESKCAQCHSLPGEMGASGSYRHPYHNDGVVSALPGTTDSEQFCVVCHTDHNKSGWLKPISDSLLANCTECHDEEQQQLINRVPDVEIPPAIPQPFETLAFPHNRHIAQEIDCIVCHRVDEAVIKDRARGIPDDPSRHDYSTVAYEICASCHQENSAPINMTAAQQQKWRPTGFQFNVAWHGTDDEGKHCMQCHSSTERDATVVFGPEMKTVERSKFSAELYQQERALFTTASRSHSEQFADHAEGKACTQCHLDGSVDTATNQQQARTFWHALHVTNGTLDPSDALGKATVSLDQEQGCVSCHNDLGGKNATSLTDASTGNYHWPDSSEAQAACAECHNEANEPLRLIAVRNQTTAETRAMPDFPHDVHVGSLSFGASGTLQQGCFACHDFSESSTDAPFSQVPIVKASAADCTSCHSGHDNIAGGDCQKCHEQTEGVSNSFLLHAKIDVPAPSTRPWPAPNSFSHLSVGHKDEDCAACHQGSGIDDAATLAAVRVPDESAALCRDCHLKKQFHWR